jgi:hypothetical protein
MTIAVNGATVEEIAAIVAAIAHRGPVADSPASNYARWRRARIKALATSRR